MGLKAGGGAARGHRAASTKGKGGNKPAGRRMGAPTAFPAGARPRRPVPAAAPSSSTSPSRDPFVVTGDWRGALRSTVEGLHYELVDVERALRGLLRVTIDRLPGQAYAAPGASITVEDCEAVTRQLQYALEVEGLDYARLEVSSPGLDRPLKNAADYARFDGQVIRLTLKQPLQGRKHFEGVLGGSGAAWQITFDAGKAEQVLSFTLDEVREARLVPVLNFKGHHPKTHEDPAAAQQAPGANEVDGGSAR